MKIHENVIIFSTLLEFDLNTNKARIKDHKGMKKNNSKCIICKSNVSNELSM